MNEKIMYSPKSKESPTEDTSLYIREQTAKSSSDWGLQSTYAFVYFIVKKKMLKKTNMFEVAAALFDRNVYYEAIADERVIKENYTLC